MSGAVAHAEPHLPVMLAEVLAALAPKPGEIIVDGTFGAGGYSRAILDTGARVIALDRDPSVRVAVIQGAGKAFSAGGSFELLEGEDALATLQHFYGGAFQDIYCKCGIGSTATIGKVRGDFKF